MADYKLSQSAQADLEDITEYTALSFGARQAAIYTAQLHNAAQTAAEFPLFGQLYSTRSGKIFRRYHSGRHALFYQLTDDGILVVRILHMMMDLDRHLD